MKNVSVFHKKTDGLPHAEFHKMIQIVLSKADKSRARTF